MNDIDLESIPTIRRAGGDALFLTVQEVHRRADGVWILTALCSHAGFSRSPEAVELVWNGRTMKACLMDSLPCGGRDFTLSIWFHPDVAILPPQ